MATDVDRLRIIYELDDLPAAKAFRRLREEAERTNAAIKGGATGAERQVVDSAKRGAEEAVQAERAKADAAEAAARKQADAAREAAREQSEAARASATAMKAAEKEKAEAAKKAAAEAKAAATALAAAEKQATAETKEAAKRAAAETAEASLRATAQAKAAAADRAAADKAAAEASKKAAKDKAAAEMAATEAADKAVSAGIYRQRMIGMQLSQVGQQAAATGNLAQALAIQLPDLALLAGGAGTIIARGYSASIRTRRCGQDQRPRHRLSAPRGRHAGPRGRVRRLGLPRTGRPERHDDGRHPRARGGMMTDTPDLLPCPFCGFARPRSGGGAVMADPYRGTALVFADVLGDPEIVFAWRPRRCYDGRLAWLYPVWRRLCLIKPHLSNGRNDDSWWQYAKPLKDKAQ